jgi:plasmid maintenance system antidote protein VapI
VIRIRRPNVKLKDVAMLANVSVGTVSRYINKHPSVSKKNAIKIKYRKLLISLVIYPT